MSAICGIFSKDQDNQINTSIIHKMVDLLKHRGDGEEKIYIDSNFGFASRDIVINPIINNRQPDHNEDQAVFVILDGKICNYQEWRDFLEKKGHKFITESNPEILTHLYEEFGTDFISKLQGEFAFALWDRKKRKLVLARDIVGNKPLHYLLKNNGITFASEIKSILCDNDYEVKLNLKALDDFFTYGYIPWPETIFEKIEQIPPGHVLTYCDGEINIKPYWVFTYDHTKIYTEDYYVENLYELIKNAIEKRLESDVACGAFLSGGLDSSTVVGLMSSILDQPVKTFSVGFEDEKYNELPWARIIANHFKTEHHEFIVKPEMVPPLFPQIVWHCDSPIVDTSCIPTYFASKLAREYVKVVLTGDGPDQLLAGSGSYVEWNQRISSISNKILSPLRTQFIANLIENLPISGTSKGFIPRLRRRIFRESMPIERQFIELEATIPTLLKKELYSDNMREIQKKNDPFLMVEPFFNRTVGYDFLDRILYCDLLSFMHDDLMVKVDRMCMANSLEIRSPFQDIHLLNFIGTIPTELKLKGIKNPIRKYVLRKAVSNLLPKEILEKKKQGFAIPGDSWLKNQLKDFVKEILLDDRTLKRGYFNEKSIQKLVSQYLKGETDYATGSFPCIISLLSFEIWNRTFIDNIQPSGPSI